MAFKSITLANTNVTELRDLVFEQGYRINVYSFIGDLLMDLGDGEPGHQVEILEEVSGFGFTLHLPLYWFKAQFRQNNHNEGDVVLQPICDFVMARLVPLAIMAYEYNVDVSESEQQIHIKALVTIDPSQN